MKNIFLFFFLFTTSIIFLAAQQPKAPNVQWANKVISVSSEYSNPDKPYTDQYRASQIIGKPNKLPAFGDSPCAWSPAKQNNIDGEYIKVGFANPMRIEQIAIAENYNPGAVTHIYVYDAADKEVLLYKNINVAPLSVQGRMNRFFQKVDFDVFAVKVVLSTSKISGYNQIDAVGISDSTEPIEAPIIMTDKEKEVFEIKSKPQNLGPNINSVYQEIAPMVTPDGNTIYFTRGKHPKNIENIDKQDVWFSKINKDGTFELAQNLGSPINTKHNNSSFSITPDGNTMLVNNVYNEDGTMEKGLSITQKEANGEWGKPKQVIIEDYQNRNAYSEYCLSQDGKVLLMTIQRVDSYGGKDIYFSRLKEDNTWSVPENLGATVNTAASETSPFLASDNKSLYYSTGGFSGYGSNDIYVTRRLDDTWKNWSEPQNLGPEINTTDWEAYFTISAKGDYAYYTSYKNSIGDSDIFRVKLSEKNRPDPVALIKGKVYNKKTGQPISANIIYDFMPEGTNAGKATSTPKTGEYKVVLPLKKKYDLLAEAKGFLSIDEIINLSDSTNYTEITKDLYLVPIEKDAMVRLNNIFFAAGFYTLLPESGPELSRLIKTMQENPSVEIRLEGHTENFGSKKEQMKLSKNRVKSVKKYLVEKGKIDEKRIDIIAYGGRYPISDGRTDEERAKNRRVEVRITKDK
ncbi:MAG: flagellar motor protein MotB [Cytophagia bacterium]|nr:MAG: flagellar motor protein MotB [Cytophagia bacterium]TAG46580.1 MAG: flagellar motor protein MotB [Cytophagia bacterium]